MSNIGNPPCDVGVIRSRKADAPCAPRSGPWILAATIIGSAMAFIDSTVTSVALPRIQERLGATAVDAQWIVESYALFLSALILVGGSLGDPYGRKRVFALGVLIFTLASVWCGLSTNAEMLILARAVHGVGGALLVPGSLSITSAETGFGDLRVILSLVLGVGALVAFVARERRTDEPMMPLSLFQSRNFSGAIPQRRRQVVRSCLSSSSPS